MDNQKAGKSRPFCVWASEEVSYSVEPMNRPNQSGVTIIACTVVCCGIIARQNNQIMYKVKGIKEGMISLSVVPVRSWRQLKEFPCREPHAGEYPVLIITSWPGKYINPG